MPSTTEITRLDLVVGYLDSEPCIIELTDDSGVARNLGANTYTGHLSNQRFPSSEVITTPDFFAALVMAVVNATGGEISFAIGGDNTTGTWSEIEIANFNDGGKQTLWYDIVENDGSGERTILEGKITVQRTRRTVSV